jgi:hypothetical protein
MADIDPDRATPASEVAAGLPRAGPEHTKHFSVVDARPLHRDRCPRFAACEPFADVARHGGKAAAC